MASQTWCVEAKVVWGSNLAFGRFGRFGRLCARCYARPSCPNYPGEASVVRPRTQSRGLLRQVPQSGRGLCRYKCSKLPISRFVQLSVMPPRSRLFKSGGPRDRCNANLGPNLRPVNSKAASFLYKINVPKTVRKGSCVYGLNRPYASRRCERPRGLFGTIPVLSRSLQDAIYTGLCV